MKGIGKFHPVIRTILMTIIILLGVVLIIIGLCVKVVDRTPYQQLGFYKVMDDRLDSLEKALTYQPPEDSLSIGWASANLTPATPAPLAGYGKRDPKTMQGIHDSTYVRCVVFKSGNKKIALFTADMLIVHPELTQQIYQLLPEGWDSNEIYLTATHTHSGPGGWAPGFVGSLFSGTYDSNLVSFYAKQFIKALLKAEKLSSTGEVSYMEFAMDDLVKNRLVGERGSVDPWLKTLKLNSKKGSGIVATFSPHATCMGSDFRQLSADFPGQLTKQLTDSLYQFAGYAAGAVGSMGTAVEKSTDWEEVRVMVKNIYQQIEMMTILNFPLSQKNANLLNSYRLKVPLRDPSFKLTTHLALRPYVFNYFFGNYGAHIQVARIGNILLIGMPCDFSGELALPLYEKARKKNLNLIITSFNGSYMGYVVKDEWYDLSKYESRTMSWYGSDIGAYFSEIISRIIDATPTN